MAKRIPEEKIAEQLAEVLDNVWFNPMLTAGYLVNGHSLYTNDQLMKLIIQIIKHQSDRFNVEWAGGRTSEALMLANHLNDVIEMHAPLNGNFDLEKYN